MNQSTRSTSLLLFGLSLCVLFIFSCAKAQEDKYEKEVEMVKEKEPTVDEIAIEKVINDLFDAMREGDSAKARRQFVPGATMGRAGYDKEGNPRLGTGNPVDGWVTAIGTPHDEVWDEQISNLKITVDVPLANAWMNFKFYRGETFSHCGVNNFMLFKGTEGWKVLSVIDTNRKDNCE